MSNDTNPNQEKIPQTPGVQVDGFVAAKVFGVLAAFCVVALGLSVLLGSVLLPRAIEQQRDRAEIDVIESLNRIYKAQTDVFKNDLDENGAQNYVDLKTLGVLKRVGPLLASGDRNGYHYVSEPGQADVGKYWWAKASPDKELKNKKSFFFINQTGEIYSSKTDFKVDRLKATVPTGLSKVRKIRKKAPEDKASK